MSRPNKSTNEPGFRLLWLLLAAPAISILPASLIGGSDDLQELAGEIAAFLIITVLMITPVARLFPGRNWTRWLLRQRRALGVAVFGYGVLHALLFFTDVPQAELVSELTKPASIFGMLALILFLLPALASNNFSTRALGRRWKSIQRLVYPATFFVALHWVATEGEPGPLLMFLPLVALRFYHWRKQRNKRRLPGNMHPAE